MDRVLILLELYPAVRVKLIQVYQDQILQMPFLHFIPDEDEVRLQMRLHLLTQLHNSTTDLLHIITQVVKIFSTNLTNIRIFEVQTMYLVLQYNIIADMALRMICQVTIIM